MSYGKPYFETYRDADGGYRWRLRAANGEVVAVGESHTRPEDASRAIGGVIDAAQAASGDVRPVASPTGE